MTTALVFTGLGVGIVVFAPFAIRRHILTQRLFREYSRCRLAVAQANAVNDRAAADKANSQASVFITRAQLVHEASFWQWTPEGSL